MEALATNVLLLNKAYVPIHVVDARRAFTLLFNKIAEVVTIEGGSYCTYNFSSWAEMSELKKKLAEESGLEDWVNTPNFILEVPRVVRLFEYAHIPTQHVILTRKNLFYRDDNTCQYCNKKAKVKDLELEHVVPRCKGGKDTWENLVCACKKCNEKKRDKTLKEAGMKLIRKPVKPKFIPNFRMCIKDKKYVTWKNFISEVYWNVELEE